MVLVTTDIQSGIRLLGNRIHELEELPPETIKGRSDGRIAALSAAIGDTLNQVFGVLSYEYQNYSKAMELMPRSRVSFSDDPPEVPSEVYRPGWERARQLLRQAQKSLEERNHPAEKSDVPLESQRVRDSSKEGNSTTKRKTMAAIHVKYQVFISSTYTDLRDERQEAIRAVLKLGHIPSGMEWFSASPDSQFEVIKPLIDQCDYYLLILGGRYGTPAPDGVGYTEKEFDYAVQKGKRVIVFPHENPSILAANRCEDTDEGKAKLRAFRDKAMKDRLVSFWKTPQDLRAEVLSSLSETIKQYPETGWIRADTIAPNKMVELEKLKSDLKSKDREIVQLQARLKDLQSQNISLPPPSASTAISTTALNLAEPGGMSKWQLSLEKASEVETIYKDFPIDFSDGTPQFSDEDDVLAVGQEKTPDGFTITRFQIGIVPVKKFPNCTVRMEGEASEGLQLKTIGAAIINSQRLLISVAARGSGVLKVNARAV